MSHVPPISPSTNVRFVFVSRDPIAHDETLDVSFYWAEALDINAEFGLCVTALFRRFEIVDPDGEHAEHRLVGLMVEDREDIWFISRDGALTLLGESLINGIEDEMDAASNWSADDGSDAAYDLWKEERHA